jgi:hypothetical protein
MPGGAGVAVWSWKYFNLAGGRFDRPMETIQRTQDTVRSTEYLVFDRRLVIGTRTWLERQNGSGSWYCRSLVVSWRENWLLCVKLSNIGMHCMVNNTIEPQK